MKRETIGAALVAMQFLLMGVLAALAASAFGHGRAGVMAWVLLLAGAALGLWALACNRPGNFNIRPLPREGGQLVQSGPYRWIRHPMYTAVLLAGAACTWAAGSGPAAAAWVALAGVLVGKATLEERWMAGQHADYARYSRHTWRFLPGLF